ncbi:hypothetical protein DICPUDRAFT_53921 [Dictyostelium purpureum]|uniref:Golgi apparatus membrane protein TVP23 homolog n=1 Tax=Dictyostelium purpureum TaxID=5786 RepID=F0ZET9_DICPU|nr:uncharacterized protein DICPUDRAFT_53921 [Dictyostelium purpureum]EGC37530.1 hypothetical protein DICPUDRAFT_53921 [Dictyostelium purpureum]|eukprot:XP_003285921.1 hypothetical protein DICPUDRAFT_53921 [Dictyostelium purpureum]
MSKVNDFGFTEDTGENHVDISISSPFIETNIAGGGSGKIGSPGGNTNNSIGSGNSGVSLDDENNFFNSNNNNNQSSIVKLFKGLSHPIASSVHVLFKVTPLILYLFSFGNSFILTFIICTLLLSFDFWTVKNISGRLMVGLRWWNQVLDDGTNKWFYETAEEGYKANQIESYIFWLGLYATPLVWVLFFIVCIFKLQFIWILIPIIAICLSLANIYGFYKCSSNSGSIVSSFATNLIGKSIMSKASSFMN